VHIAATAPVLVPDAPDSDLERVRCAVRAPFVGKRAIAAEVAVLYPVTELVRCPGAEVSGEIGFRAERAAEGNELMGSEVVRLRGHAPVRIETHRAGLARTDTIAPVIVIREAPAGPAQDRDSQRLQRLDNIVTDTIRIGNRAMRTYPDAIIDQFAQMFGEV
jgi:hypothetical protein